MRAHEQTWLATFLDVSHDVPSADTLRRTVAALLPRPFRKAFVAWAHALVASADGKQVAIDGKTARGSTNDAGHVLHVVRAWVKENALVLGQVATDAKSNEITAIPELLELLSLRGATVSVDAMDTQREIGLSILEKDAHSQMALKDNQPTICASAQVELGTKTEPRRSTPTFHKTEDKGHGRTEVQPVWVTSKLDHLEALIGWPDVQTLNRVEFERCVEGKTSFEDRYYLCSRVLTAKESAPLVRGHWSIENACHWTLDVVFGEDDAWVREGYAPENLGLVRSLILNVFKRDTTPKASLKRKFKMCAWDHDFLLGTVRRLFSLGVCACPGHCGHRGTKVVAGLPCRPVISLAWRHDEDYPACRMSMLEEHGRSGALVCRRRVRAVVPSSGRGHTRAAGGRGTARVVGPCDHEGRTAGPVARRVGAAIGGACPWTPREGSLLAVEGRAVDGRGTREEQCGRTPGRSGRRGPRTMLRKGR